MHAYMLDLHQNKHLISKALLLAADSGGSQVTNWKLSNRQVWLIIPVVVAYGSEVFLVMEMLIVCARANSKVAQTRVPRVLWVLWRAHSTSSFVSGYWMLMRKRQKKANLFVIIFR